MVMSLTLLSRFSTSSKYAIVVGNTLLVLGMHHYYTNRISSLKQKVSILNAQLQQANSTINNERVKFKQLQQSHIDVLFDYQIESQTITLEKLVLQNNKIRTLQKRIRTMEEDKKNMLQQIEQYKYKNKELREAVDFFQSEDVWVKLDLGKVTITADMFRKKTKEEEENIERMKKFLNK